VPSAAIGRVLPEEGPGWIGDKSNSVLFDNTKIKSLVPEFTATIRYSQGAQEMVEWYDAHPDARAINPEFERGLDTLVAQYG
jgi:hypothetical protein